MARVKPRSAACAFVALALALWGVPFGQVAAADELQAQSLRPDAVERYDGDVWDGTADTGWYNAGDAQFTITTAEQLAGLAEIVNGTAIGIARDDFAGKTVTLGANIVLNASPSSAAKDSSQRNWTPIGCPVLVRIDQKDGHDAPVYSPPRPFNGTFDGAGYAVKNIYKHETAGYGGYSGLFGVLGAQATVTHVTMQGGYLYGRIAGSVAAISLVGLDDMAGGGPLIDNCYSNVTVAGNGSSTRAAGGLFGGDEAYSVSADGYQAMARIKNCHFDGRVFSYASDTPVGGIAGYGSVQVENCLCTGEVRFGGSANSGKIVGAVLQRGYQNGSHGTGVGERYNGFVRNCNASSSGVMFHAFAVSGDESTSKAEATAVRNSADVFALGGYPWSGLSDADESGYVVGDAFAVVRSDDGYGYELKLAWMAGEVETLLTDGCIVGGVSAVYAACGSAVKPEPVVRLGLDTLEKGRDYEVSYQDAAGDPVDEPADVGFYRVVVEGKAPYRGIAVRVFSIEEPFLSVYTKADAGAEPQLARQFLKFDMQKLVDPEAGKISALFGTEADGWSVATSARYVTIDDVVAAAGVPAASWKNGALLAVSGMGGNSASFTYDELHDGVFYEMATARGFATQNGSLEVRKVPAALALLWSSGAIREGQTAYLQESNNANRQSDAFAPKLFVGVSKASYSAEEYASDERLVEEVETLTVTLASASKPEPAPVKVDLGKKAKIAVKDQVYSGKALAPAVAVKVGSTTLKKGVDYTVAYAANKNVGTATVTVKAAAKSKKWKGAKKATFKINPRVTKLTKLTGGKKQLAATWGKASGQAGGYQLMLATNGKFTAGKKTVTVKSAKTTKATVKKLAAKKYWAKVRVFKKVGKATYWSAWSKALAAKVK